MEVNGDFTISFVIDERMIHYFAFVLNIHHF